MPRPEKKAAVFHTCTSTKHTIARKGDKTYYVENYGMNRVRVFNRTAEMPILAKKDVTAPQCHVPFSTRFPIRCGPHATIPSPSQFPIACGHHASSNFLRRFLTITTCGNDVATTLFPTGFPIRFGHATDWPEAAWTLTWGRQELFRRAMKKLLKQKKMSVSLKA